jgi:hypothetical protein
MDKKIRYKATIVSALILMFGFFGCSNVEKEIRMALSENGTAIGSEFVTQLCGWPSTAKLDITKFDMKLTPDSTQNDGSGFVDITAKGEGYICDGKIFFTYSSAYAGGHGFSGSNDLHFGIIQRETDVAKEISSHEKAIELKLGEKKTGSVSEQSYRLPDGSYAEYYYVDLKGDNPAIKVVTTTLTKDFIVRGSMYQNNKLISGLSIFGTKFMSGRVYILITGGKHTGNFSITINELSEDEKSKLK